MDYSEAYQALEEFVNSEKYQSFEEELGSADVHPETEVIGDRAIFYVQIEDNSALSDTTYERKVLAEYRDGSIGPIPLTEEELEEGLQGRGDVTIDESLLEPRDINFPEQRKAR
ncbi:MAG: hypothetical protein ABEJ87_03540 [Candidatus Nanohalobium sp.]